MTTLSDSDKDPNLDEYAYEHRVEDSGEQAANGADEHADNPHPDADGDVTAGGGADPDAPDTSGVIDPDAD
ncbi:hypothetical protein ACEXQE_00470 [Herbiconiux sp. P17]|uniref:hypothetical protein n=1 Tax=Herbiconiux wuyangfengii TaxID=3342794 RepID=UPI0035B99FE3